VQDCLSQCIVSYFNPAKQEWFYRTDQVAAYYSFDDPVRLCSRVCVCVYVAHDVLTCVRTQMHLGKDDSDNGLNLVETTVAGMGTTQVRHRHGDFLENSEHFLSQGCAPVSATSPRQTFTVCTVCACVRVCVDVRVIKVDAQVSTPGCLQTNQFQPLYLEVCECHRCVHVIARTVMCVRELTVTPHNRTRRVRTDGCRWPRATSQLLHLCR
jgi:hypothetical protein